MKKLTRDELLDDLTVAREGVREADITYMDREELEQWDTPRLEKLRLDTKKKRKEKQSASPSTTSTGTGTRRTFSKDGIASIRVPVVLDEATREMFSTLQIKTEEAATDYLSKFITTKTADGPGANSFIPKDDRPAKIIVIDANGIVRLAVSGIADAAKHRERLEAVKGLYQNCLGMREMGDPDFETDAQIHDKLLQGCIRSGKMTDEEALAVVDEVMG